MDPLATLLLLTPFGKYGFRQQTLISFCGLRGAASIVFAIMAVGTLFVSKFISIARQHDEMRSAMSETVATLRLLDRDYHTHADTRIARAPQRLRSTLTILLYPQDEAKIWETRRNWLDSLKDDDVWNVFMPSNVRALSDAAQRWAAEYADISAVILRDEPQDCAPFAPSASTTRLADITAESRRITLPDTAGAAASAMLAGLMMLCYIATRRPTSDAEGTHR